MQDKKWTVEEVENLLALMRKVDVLSLNRQVINNNDINDYTEMGDFILDDAPGPEDIVEQKETKQTLINFVNKLPPRECAVIKLRYGLEDGRPRTLDEIGSIYKVTRERIRQIEMKAMSKLKQLITVKGKYKNIYDV